MDQVIGTFGGWSLRGGGRRAQEGKVAERLIFDTYGYDAEYVPMAAYNKHAWVKEWNEFWKLVHIYCDRHPRAMVVSFDVANFYDTVELNRLERQLRRIPSHNELALETLLFFLSYWNKSQNMYVPSSKGLPQDVSGDCSRILANFYLRPFDHAFAQFIRGTVGGEYLRYSDDMLVFIDDNVSEKRVLFEASRLLALLGLNINQAKVSIQRVEEVRKDWLLEPYSRLSMGDIDGFLRSFDLATMIGHRRGFTVMLKAVNSIWDALDLEGFEDWDKKAGRNYCQEVMDLVSSDVDMQLRLKWINWQRLAGLVDHPEEHFIRAVGSVFALPFSEPKLHLLRFARKSLRNRHLRGCSEIVLQGAKERSIGLSPPERAELEILEMEAAAYAQSSTASS